MADHGHGGGGGHAPASGGGGHAPSGGGAPLDLKIPGFIIVVLFFIFCVYIPLRKKDQEITSKTSKKVTYEEAQVDSIPFSSEFGDFYYLETDQPLQFDPTCQPLDGIDNHGHTFHLDINENLGWKIPKNIPANYKIKLRSSNGVKGKLAYAKLRQK